MILWRFLAIVLGMIVSMAFLPLLGVNPIEATKIMFTEVFSDKFTMGNILVKTTPPAPLTKSPGVCLYLQGESI